MVTSNALTNLASPALKPRAGIQFWLTNKAALGPSQPTRHSHGVAKKRPLVSSDLRGAQPARKLDVESSTLRYLMQNKLMAFQKFRDLQLREDDFTTANPSQVGDSAEAYASAGPAVPVHPTVADATHNVSMSPEILCYMSALTDVSQGDTRYSASSCPVVWDGLTCWPQTAASSLAVVPCFASLNGLDYDTAPFVFRPLTFQDVGLSSPQSAWIIRNISYLEGSQPCFGNGT
ncbi:hypothetical protein MTO96_050899 [Rhipicephalus appendiculatus]